ncbi:MAG: ATPase, partial [Candidatus Aenigmarchaeota archaeon]|nr:ATPase [Candidatus Aenigmarchaeota archaeon]
KSTLAGSLAEFYNKQEKIVKTMESPRDLQVGPGVTQYAPLAKDFAKTAEILLLVRPDYTIFDEVRNSADFKIFADMRLAGVGMLGVVNASTPIDSIQRFMRKIELGMMHSIVDTIIFVEDGKIKEVFSLALKIKIPTGMKGHELARPLIEMRNFETGKLEYEIYTFGNETVVMPMKKNKEKNEIKIKGKIKSKSKTKIEEKSKTKIRNKKPVVKKAGNIRSVKVKK